MPAGSTAGSPLPLGAVVAVLDKLIGEAKSVARARTPAESIGMSVNMMKTLKEVGVSTVDDAISTLEQLTPLVRRFTE